MNPRFVLISQKTLARLSLLALLIFGFPIPSSQAYYSFQTTASSGYYRDMHQNAKWPLIVYWNLNHVSQANVQTSVDLGINNTILPSQWQFSLYQAYVDVPIEFKGDAFTRSHPHLLVGRQMLTEGFELSAMDGATVTYLFSEKFSFNGTAGILRNLENKNLEKDTQVYGGTFAGEVAETQGRAGYFYKHNTTGFEHLGHATLMREWNTLPWTPVSLVKGQWQLSSLDLDQALAEIELHPDSKLSGTIDYSSRKPTAFDATNSLYIYRLFSISAQKSCGTHWTWSLLSDLRLQAGFDTIGYNSPAGPERSTQEDTSLTWSLGHLDITPSVVHLKSYGGNLWQFGVRAVQSLSSYVRMHGELNTAQIDKVNGLSGWAYHGRGGVEFHLGSSFLAMGLIEVERNNIFKIESRAVAYVSHFYY